MKQLTRAEYRRLISTQHYRVKSLEYFLAVAKSDMLNNIGNGKAKQHFNNIRKLTRDLAAERRIQNKLKLLAQ